MDTSKACIVIFEFRLLQAGAAKLLQQWLSEAPPAGWTWDRLAGESGPESITDGERADLYSAYLKHVVVPEVRRYKKEAGSLLRGGLRDLLLFFLSLA